MIKRDSVNFEIGFADGEVISYNRKNDNLIISVKAWNEKTILVLCKDLIGFFDKGAWDISDFCEVKSETNLLREVLNRQFEKPPKDHGYKVFQFLDIDDQVVIEVICSEIEINME